MVLDRLSTLVAADEVTPPEVTVVDSDSNRLTTVKDFASFMVIRSEIVRNSILTGRIILYLIACKVITFLIVAHCFLLGVERDTLGCYSQEAVD